jgi:hypothetical protein
MKSVLPSIFNPDDFFGLHIRGDTLKNGES